MYCWNLTSRVSSNLLRKSYENVSLNDFIVVESYSILFCIKTCVFAAQNFCQGIKRPKNFSYSFYRYPLLLFNFKFILICSFDHVKCYTFSIILLEFFSRCFISLLYIHMLLILLAHLENPLWKVPDHVFCNLI